MTADLLFVGLAKLSVLMMPMPAAALQTPYTNHAFELIPGEYRSL